jgi:hypothetical protein
MVNEEFYDVIHEYCITVYNVIYRVAAYAKKHLEAGREYSSKLPKHAHRALLLAIEAD